MMFMTSVTSVRTLAACVAALLAAASAVVVRIEDDPSSTRAGGPPPAARSENRAARAFLDRYVESNGRVVRHDQGGDTVSEGQAYAMLIAAQIGDQQVFDRVWRWTRERLERDDGLLSWHWRDGGVVDRESAADADLDAAHALVLASDRFGLPSYREEAMQLAAAIRGGETAVVEGVRYLLPGPWALGARPYRYNPSYVSPVAFAALGWTDVAVPGTGEGAPPDWCVLRDDGRLERRAGYGYEAARVPVRLAISPDHRHLAAAMWPALRRHPFTDDHPVGMIGAAAAAMAAGDRHAAEELAARARRFDAASPTYYGAAWIALAELWLDL